MRVIIWTRVTTSLLLLLQSDIVLGGKTKQNASAGGGGGGGGNNNSLNSRRSFVYQSDGISSDETLTVMSEPPPKPAGVVDVSFCVRIMLYIFKPSIAYIFESGLSDEDRATSDYDGLERFNLLFSLTAEGSWVGVKSHNFFTDSGHVLPLEWNHFCFAHNVTLKSVVMVQNGRVVLNVSDDQVFDDTPLPKDFIANVVLGQRQPLLRDSRHSLSGEISHFNLWRRELRLEEMFAITTCRSEEVKNRLKEDLVVDWNTQKWRHQNVTERPLAFSSSNCHSDGRENLVMFPEKRGFESANLLCRVLNGTMAVPEDSASNEKLHNVCNRRHLEYVWLGIQDVAEEKSWVHVGDRGRKLRATSRETDWQVPWETRPQEPNGHTKENCAAMKRGKTWIDIECSFKLCTACNFSTPTPRLQLLGLCPGSTFDTQYTLQVEKYRDGKHFFRGFFGSEIRWERESAQWALVSPGGNGGAKAVYNASDDYPLGKRQWFFDDDSCCGGGEMQYKKLKLTACGRNEFTCDDGSCIAMRGRCDHRQDCSDYSDEFDCRLLGLQKSHYIKDYAPGAGYKEEVTVVTYKVEILSVDQIRELGMTLNVQFRLTMAWFDPRIVFYNLKGDDSMNALTQEEKKKIWIPSIVFNNTDDENESVLDDKARLIVLRKGNYTVSSTQDPDEKHVFSGSENPLVYQRHHNVQFQCNFDMTYYPFDVQRCYMIFVHNQRAGKFLLKAAEEDSLLYLGERELLQYYIKDWSLSSVTDSGFVIAITMKRRYLYQLLTTYLPSLCLFCIIHATQYFKISYFHTTIMVSLTGMLVMTTLFLNTSASLPKTSYFKMIDIWMVFGLLLPFFEVVLHTVTEYRKADMSNAEMLEEEDIVVNGERSVLLRIRGNSVTSVPFVDDNRRRCEKGKNNVSNDVRVAVIAEEGEGVKQQQQNSAKELEEPLLRKTSRALMGLLQRKASSATAAAAADDPDGGGGGGCSGSGRSCRPRWLFCRQKDEITQHFSRTVVPLLVLLFNLVYWTVAFLHD